MRDVKLNQQEQARIKVLNCVLERQLPIAQIADIMGVSERHQRMVERRIRSARFPAVKSLDTFDSRLPLR